MDPPKASLKTESAIGTRCHNRIPLDEVPKEWKLLPDKEAGSEIALTNANAKEGYYALTRVRMHGEISAAGEVKQSAATEIVLVRKESGREQTLFDVACKDILDDSVDLNAEVIDGFSVADGRINTNRTLKFRIFPKDKAKKKERMTFTSATRPVPATPLIQAAPTGEIRIYRVSKTEIEIRQKIESGADHARLTLTLASRYRLKSKRGAALTTPSAESVSDEKSDDTAEEFDPGEDDSET